MIHTSWGWVRKFFFFHLLFLHVFPRPWNSHSQAIGKLETVAHHYILLSKYLFLSSFSWSSIATVHVKIDIVKIRLQTVLANTLTQSRVSWWWDTTWNAHRCTVYTFDLQRKYRLPVAMSNMSWVGFENRRPWTKWEFKKLRSHYMFQSWKCKLTYGESRDPV